MVDGFCIYCLPRCRAGRGPGRWGCPSWPPRTTTATDPASATSASTRWRRRPAAHHRAWAPASSDYRRLDRSRTGGLSGGLRPAQDVPYSVSRERRSNCDAFAEQQGIGWDEVVTVNAAEDSARPAVTRPAYSISVRHRGSDRSARAGIDALLSTRPTTGFRRVRGGFRRHPRRRRRPADDHAAVRVPAWGVSPGICSSTHPRTPTRGTWSCPARRSCGRRPAGVMSPSPPDLDREDRHDRRYVCRYA